MSGRGGGGSVSVRRADGRAQAKGGFIAACGTYHGSVAGGGCGAYSAVLCVVCGGVGVWMVSEKGRVGQSIDRRAPENAPGACPGRNE